MDQKLEAGSDRVYEDFTPYYEWARDEGSIIVLLPGYRRDQVKVQVTSKPVLKLMGERQIIGNRWGRLNIEFPLPSDYDTDNVTAKFEASKLYIKFAKLDHKPKEPTNPLVEDPNPNKEPSQKVDQNNANNEISDQKTPQKEKDPNYEKEKSKTEETEAASIDKMAQKNGLTETREAAISKVAQTKVVAKPVSRSKTRLLDFTLSLGPSNNHADIDNEDIGDLDSRINKRKKLVKGVFLILLAVVLGFYARNNAFRHSSIGLKFQEL